MEDLTALFKFDFDDADLPFNRDLIGAFYLLVKLYF